MPELSLRDIDQIRNDIRKQDIIFSHLLDELIDHVCCDVEYEMQTGLSFHEAYLMVKEKMGSRRMKEIQEETLYAVDTKYRQMKKTMKISAIAGTIMLGFASLFKIMHWPGAGALMTLGAISLAFVFIPSALVVLWKETRSGKRLFLYISAFLAGMLFIVGAAFKVQHWTGAGVVLLMATFCGNFLFIPSLLVIKLRDQEKRSKRAVYILGAAALICYITGLFLKIQHWPGSGSLLLCGIIIIFLVVFPWYTWITWKNESNVSAQFIFMVIGSLAVMVPSALLNLNLQRSYEAGYFVHQQQQQAMYNYEFNRGQSFLLNHKDSASVPLLMEIQSRTNELLKVINGIEADMIAESEGEHGVPAVISQQILQKESGPEIQFGLLIRPFDTRAVGDFLLPGCSTRNMLNDGLKGYADYLSGLTGGSEPGRFEKLLDPSVFLPADASDGTSITLMSGLHSLALLKNTILTVESIAFSTVSAH
ncbi:MAG TPA: hypothetical protein VMV74_12550 [Bacteroidales bacterium]|nr:hypothetical protein [Bacteroidales bacterium]